MKQSLAGQVDESRIEQTTHTPGVKRQEDGEAEGQQKKASKHKSFDEVPAQGSGIPDGKYTAIIYEMILQPADSEKGESVRFKVMIADDDYQGEEITGWWKLWNDDQRDDVAGGAQFFKRCMAMLEKRVTQANIAEICEEVNEEKPGVAIQKKTNGNFENVYFNGVLDDDAPTIASLRANHPF